MDVAQPDQASTGSADRSPLEALFLALESPLLAYATRLTGDPAAAEDVVQDAFMKLHTQFGNVTEPSRWLYRTVHNLALNHQRAAGRTVTLATPADDSARPAPDFVDPQPLPDEQIARWENMGHVQLSLRALDERSRELVRLKFHEDLSYKEMAARTGLSPGLVGYLLHHALKTIADELARTGVLP